MRIILIVLIYPREPIVKINALQTYFWINEDRFFKLTSRQA